MLQSIEIVLINLYYSINYIFIFIMTLTNTSTYKEFQTTNFYKSMKNYVMTQSPVGKEPFTEQQAEGMLNSFYWRSYSQDNLEGIS